jgi:hypothetical protein
MYASFVEANYGDLQIRMRAGIIVETSEMFDLDRGGAAIVGE